MVEDFEEDETPLQDELEAKLAARVCKRMAVKAGQTLAPDEQRALVADLESCELAADLSAWPPDDDLPVRGHA